MNHTSDTRPLIVMVTGEPGSGKTSLGLELASALRVPFFSRDRIRGGLLATAGLWTDDLRDAPPREAAVDVFVEMVESSARLGVTSVIEFIVTPQRLEAFDRLMAAADCVVILATCHEAARRAEHRDRADPLLNRGEVLQALGHSSIDDYLAGPERDRIRSTMRSEFDLPQLRVATDDGYDPPLDAIVEWIIDQTSARGR